jgi:hypothetical protein
MLAIAAASAWAAADAVAAPVLVLGPDGHTVLHQDPYLPAVGFDFSRLHAVAARAARPASRRPAPQRTVRSELLRLMRAHAITHSAYDRYSSEFNAALASERRLGGTRRTELQAITVNLHDIAASGQLAASRLPALFLILERNRQWWTSGPLLSSGDRVGFAGSEIVWEYYPGQGIQLQPLGSFGKADGFYTGGRSLYPRLRHLLAELVPIASKRGGGLTWEYYFSFDGGSPPWTSAMSQGTALEALTRAYRAFHDRSYLATAGRALAIFHRTAPLGVTTPTRLGSRYLLYSFAPGAHVLNGFLWTLVGLWDYAYNSHNADAWRLFHAGDAEARAEVPHYDTGSWSLYQPGVQDSVDYHKLVTGFLHSLCARTHARVYCVTAEHFDSYLARRGG